MTWETTVGIDGGRWRATKWVMMWAMMWATGTMAATPPKGMAGTPAGRGGGLLAKDAVAAGGSSDGGGGGCISQGSLLFIVKIFVCGVFMLF